MFGGSRFEKGSLGLIVLVIAGLLFSYFSADHSFLLAIFFPSEFQLRPWTAITNHFITGSGSRGFITCLFACLWIFQIGSRIERELGTGLYLSVVVGLSTLSSLLVWLGFLATQTPGAMYAPFVMLAVITVLWASRYPTEEVRFWGVFPIQAKWLGWISTGFVFFATPPALALFAAAPLALAWAYAAGKLPIAYGRSLEKPKEKVVIKNFRENEAYFDDAHRRAKEREEREKLRKLFGESVSEDDKPQ